MTRRRVPPGALLEPHVHGHDATEIALARAEDRIRDLELETRSLALEIRDLRRDTADAALLGSALRKVGQAVTGGRSPPGREIVPIRSSVQRKRRISVSRTTGERGGRRG